MSEWKEFKEKEKIWAGDYMKAPDDCLLIIDDGENYWRKEFNELIKQLEQLGISEYKISPLTNEDGEYTGCFLSSVILNGIEISTEAISPYEREDDLQPYAKLYLTKKRGVPKK